jgi:uncharacterized protein (TIGR02996 family)
MTDADFLRDIIANRDDDGPRLVYADWLDERGDPKRAEFIRVQCELAKPEPVCTGYYCDEEIGHVDCDYDDKMEERSALRRRERELLIAHGERWFAGLPGGWLEGLAAFWVGKGKPVAERTMYAIRRGFVAAVTCTWEAFGGGVCQKCREWTESEFYPPNCDACHGTGRTPGLADAILASTPLEVVRLTTMPAPGGSIESVTNPGWRPGTDAPLGQWRFAGRKEVVDFREVGPAAGVHRRIVSRLLAAEWPTLTFELPEEGQWTLYLPGTHIRLRARTRLVTGDYVSIHERGAYRSNVASDGVAMTAAEPGQEVLILLSSGVRL